uniref:Uncharacterized protein n=1 Tax=Globisporangium ultimum (strain ATCC 200006 / CBS 805.95 / DAOM BR144) TaxID=431595 RepID=K3XBT8_GLOUD
MIDSIAVEKLRQERKEYDEIRSVDIHNAIPHKPINP